MADVAIIGAFILAAIGILMMVLVAIGSSRPEDWDWEDVDPDPPVDPTTDRWRSAQVEAERRRLYLVDPDRWEVANSDNKVDGPGRPPHRRIP